MWLESEEHTACARFVRHVTTIVVIVAVPGGVDTVPVGTCELVRSARRLRYYTTTYMQISSDQSCGLRPRAWSHIGLGLGLGLILLVLLPTLLCPLPCKLVDE